MLGEEPLDLPERTLDTTAVVDAAAGDLAEAGLEERDLPGAAHAAEHVDRAAPAVRHLRPLGHRRRVDRAAPGHRAAHRLRLRRAPGRGGFAERGFHAAADWLTATRQAISSCRCDDGCPSCVQSPKCGNGNNPLDKHVAVQLLDVLLAGCPGSGLDAAERGTR